MFFSIDLLVMLQYIIYFFFLYFLGLWVFQDADRRGVNGYFWSLMCVFFPLAGIPFYLILRPKGIVKKCPDCERFPEKDAVLCYYCPYNETEKKDRPPFHVYIISLSLGLLHSAFMTVRYFIFMSFNSIYEKLFLLRTARLRRMDGLIKKYYFLKSPILMAKKIERELGLPYFALTYGETPYSTARNIFDRIRPAPGDIFFDLGSGVGQLVFFVNLYYKVPCAGIDLVPFFIEKSNLIKKDLNLNEVEFIYGDFLEKDISWGTIFYINGRAFNIDIIEKVVKKFDTIKEGSKVISVGYPFALPSLRIIDKSLQFFSWGWDDVYIQEKSVE